jgi:hypothetical protein
MMRGGSKAVKDNRELRIKNAHLEIENRKLALEVLELQSFIKNRCLVIRRKG